MADVTEQVVEQVKESQEAPVEEVVVTFGDAPPEPEEAPEQGPAPLWVKKVRERDRELSKQVRELAKQNAELAKKLEASDPAKKQDDPGKRPELGDFDYDTGKYEAAVESWIDRKKAADVRAAQARAVQEAADNEWKARMEAYNQAKTSIAAEDYEEAEFAVQGALDQTQQGIIVHGAENPAMFVYALGKNPDKLKELSAIKDPVKYAFAVAKLEASMKVGAKKPATQPETRISGNGRPSGVVDNTLDRLREEAEKTRDFTQVHKYKMQQRAKNGY